MSSRRLQDPSNAYTPNVPNRPFNPDPTVGSTSPQDFSPPPFTIGAPRSSFKFDEHYQRAANRAEQHYQQQQPQAISPGTTTASSTTTPTTTIVPVNGPALFPPSAPNPTVKTAPTAQVTGRQQPQRTPYPNEPRWIWPSAIGSEVQRRPTGGPGAMSTSGAACEPPPRPPKIKVNAGGREEDVDEAELDDLPGLLRGLRKPYEKIVVAACVEAVLGRHQRRCVQYAWREVGCTEGEYRAEVEGMVGGEEEDGEGDEDEREEEGREVEGKEKEDEEEGDMVIIGSSDPTSSSSSKAHEDNEDGEEGWTKVDEAESDSEWQEAAAPTSPTLVSFPDPTHPPPTKSTATQTTPRLPHPSTTSHPLPQLPSLPPARSETPILNLDPKIYHYIPTYASAMHLRRNMLPPIVEADVATYTAIVEFIAKRASVGLVTEFLRVYDDEFRRDNVSGGEGGLFVVDLLEGVSTLYEIVGRKRRRRDRKVLQTMVKTLGGIWRWTEGEVVRYWRGREGVVEKVWTVWERVVEEEDDGLVGLMLKEGLGRVVGLRRVLGLVRRRGTVDMREMVEEAVGLCEDMEVEIGGREWEGVRMGVWDWEPFRVEEMRLLGRSGDN